MANNRVVALCGGLCLAVGFALAETPANPVESRLEFSSSDTRLTEGFEWAKRQALAYVFDGDPVGPWYEASLPGRAAFCMRDVSHQCMGAHALGLDRYNHNMLRKFAANISKSKDWCSFWEIDRLDRASPVDYRSDTDFWYNLPANFDVLDACFRMYQWTGDKSYIEDPVFLNFYERSLTDYVERWQLSPDRVMKRQRIPDFGIPARRRGPMPMARGIPGYDEGNHEYVVAVDLLAAQYAAYRAYARIEELRGNSASSEAFQKKATAVRTLVNETWWNEKAGVFYEYLDTSGRFAGSASTDLLYRGVTEPGPKTQAALQTLLDRIRQGVPVVIELQSYQPGVLYRYGEPRIAYARMMDLVRPDRKRREYPEVSYSVIGDIVTGTMGISMDGGLRTLAGLGDIAWAEVRHLPVGTNFIAVRHDGVGKTTLINESGPALAWQAAFEGSFSTLLVKGKPFPARVDKALSGRAISLVTVNVAPGKSVRVKIPGK